MSRSRLGVGWRPTLGGPPLFAFQLSSSVNSDLSPRFIRPSWAPAEAINLIKWRLVVMTSPKLCLQDSGSPLAPCGEPRGHGAAMNQLHAAKLFQDGSLKRVPLYLTKNVPTEKPCSGQKVLPRRGPYAGDSKTRLPCAPLLTAIWVADLVLHRLNVPAAPTPLKGCLGCCGRVWRLGYCEALMEPCGSKQNLFCFHPIRLYIHRVVLTVSCPSIQLVVQICFLRVCFRPSASMI